MSSSLNKAKIPIASAKLYKFDLPQMHITTSSFMRFSVACCRQLIKRTTIKDHHDTFIRTSPLIKPFYGNVNVHDRAFFVPYRVIWEPFEDFRNNVPHNQPEGTSLISFVPSMTLDDMLAALTGSDSGFVNRVHGNVYDLDIGTDKFVFTSAGRAAVSLLESLGYKVFYSTNAKSIKYSCCPLLAVAKIYLDWYFPSAYAHYGLSAFLDGILQRQVYYELTADEIYRILRLILYVSYDSDFYTSLWDNPIGVNTGAGSVDFQILDSSLIGSDVNSSNRSLVVQSDTGTPYVSASSVSTVRSLTQFMDSSLKALTSYVARHRMAGSRALDRALAAYGVMLSAEKLKRCYYLGSNEYPLHVADVMSTAETDEASLGAYAGKAIASSSKVFESYSDEDGFFVIINSIVPQPIYYQGVDPNVEMRSVLEFHNGEFDGLGPVAVRASNLYVEKDSDSATALSINDTFINQIFGFAPRYYHLKIPFNRVTGDFTFNSINTDLYSWFIARRLYPDATDATTLAGFKHNLDFVLGLDNEQYKSLFGVPSEHDSTDVFYIIHRDHITLESPMKPLYDTFEFEDEKDSKKVTTEPNGVKLN